MIYLFIIYLFLFFSLKSCSIELAQVLCDCLISLFRKVKFQRLGNKLNVVPIYNFWWC